MKSNYLEHYGVPGMKWGVRKRSAKEEKERAKRFKAVKNRRTLSDEELKKRVERLQTEKRFKELSEQDLSPGRSVAKRIVSESGQRVAKTALTGATLYAVKAVLERKFDLNEASKYMTPKPKK